jgi:hypothetical protein
MLPSLADVAVVVLPLGAADAAGRAAARRAGALLARHVAARLARCDAGAVAWARAGALSKPFAELVTAPGVPIAALSLSYAAAAVACAFCRDARASVGVDVIAISRAAEAAPGARALLGGALVAPLGAAAGAPVDTESTAPPLSPAAFALRWTLIEAVLKARGAGFAVDGAARAVVAEARAAPLAPGAPAPAVLVASGALAGPIEERALAAAAAAAGALEACAAAAPAPEGARLVARFEAAAWRAATFALTEPGGGDELFLCIVLAA